ncbi:TadG family pilus assembly protein [Burkholderia sp. 8Y]|uniref:TadG family pilus assembly protein n=1 Tax=Burkholderia sp. 8Y TaxID=2653133 RepID=UPI00135B3E4E|nr:TadG family pilus assembly protein [Burkholderia sp. 8Y]
MSIAMLFSLSMALMVGALAIDIGHLFLAHAELQTAADAAALTGAGSLLAGGSSPNWSSAQAAALKGVSLNASDGTTLTQGSIASGYWNLTGSPAGLQAQSITPGTYDAPAVQVTVSRATGINGGPVAFFFAGLFGISSGPASATAAAVVAAPGTVAPNALFPVAIGQCIYSQYWNAQSGTPTTDSTGMPYEVQIGNGQLYNGCEAGQWTSFQANVNDVPTVRGLITDGNSTSLSIGDSIWIQSGIKTTIYSYVPTNVDVLVPVVDQTTSATHPIIAFAAFHIDSASGGNDKAIVGHFIAGYKVAAMSGAVGPYYGAYVPPRLVE